MSKSTSKLFTPFADRVLIKPDAAEEMIGSIIVPDSAKERPARGEIIAVGPGRRDDRGGLVKCESKVGQTVLYGKYAGTDYSFEGQDYLIMRDADVFGGV